MRHHRRKRALNKDLEYNLLIEHEKLFHYESLLIGRLDKIKSDYDTKIGNSKLSYIISLFLPFLGYTNDVIGIQIIKSIKNYKEIIFFIVILAPSILSLISVFKYKKIKDSLNIEFMKNKSNQERIFIKFIIEKAEKQDQLYEHLKVLSSENFKHQHDLVEYHYSGNKIKIIFFKSQLKEYIDDYLRMFDNGIDYEISTFLSEVIVSRGLIKNNIRKSIYDDSFEYTIDKTNIVHILTMLSFG